MNRLILTFKTQLQSIRNQDGVAALEFVLCIPLLLVIFFGTIEVSRYYLAVQKVEKTIDLVTDTVSRSDSNYDTEKLTSSNLGALMAAVREMMRPYGFSANGVVILTSVTQPSDISQPPVINWQYCGGGGLTVTSSVGTSSGTSNKNTATLSGFTLNAGEEVLVGEVIYNFSPLTLQDMVGSVQIYRRTLFIPRVGPLNSFTSKCS